MPISPRSIISSNSALQVEGMASASLNSANISKQNIAEGSIRNRSNTHMSRTSRSQMQSRTSQPYLYTSKSRSARRVTNTMTTAEMKEQQELKECSFKPKLNQSSFKTGSRLDISPQVSIGGINESRSLTPAPKGFQE